MRRKSPKTIEFRRPNDRAVTLRNVKITDEAHHWLRLLSAHLEKEMSELATGAVMRCCEEHLPAELLSMLRRASEEGPSPAGERRGSPDRRRSRPVKRSQASRKTAARK